ncbi:glycoside hydrolase family 2 TIM barrel-domain containing protein [Pontibacter sp. 13R65]|uniref:glycoside hydrolase family 2 TIM barrel-domain containing protein n=1 Tax=Pontibacter sp. 13R65 TaxID=3127458 RepID=UPI00301CDAC1
MKNQLLLSLIGLLFVCLPDCLMAQQVRKEVLFNDSWKFYKGDVTSGETPGFDDKNWREVELPHDWSIEGPFSPEWASSTGYLPGGIGWYRKTFELTSDVRSKNLFLYFDGVYKNSEVWINGHYLGKRPNGYTSFYYELTQHLNKKGKNILAVKVDHTKFADSRWYPGSGIYRNVYLMAVEPVHIKVWGVAFTTPEVSQSNASAQVVVSLNNKSKKAADIEVRAELRDKQGKTIADNRQKIQAKAGQEAEARLAFQVKNPKLWSVDDPNLYELHVASYVNGKKTDNYVEKVGFRNFRFDANKGFFLNDENIKLKGVCFHHDAGALGAAVPEEVWVRRLKALKELGCNAIRMSHYPHQDYIYKLCDEMGFLVQDEAFDEWELGKNKWIEGWNVGKPGNDGYHEHFAEWAERDLRDMILRNRNHASIIMWSIGNEIDYPNDPYSHEVLNTGRNPQIYGKGYQPNNPPASRLGEIAKRLVAVAKEYDITRPITAALAGVVMSNFTTYPDELDVVGYNYQEYRYPEDHEKHPNRIIYGSENGKGLDAWLAVDTLDYISAQFLWTAFDFMGEARSWPVRSSGAGLLDLAGFPKPDYFFRQSLWSDKPMVYIATAKVQEQVEGQRYQPLTPAWNWAAGDKIKVSCYTNADEAELFLNGKSLGRKPYTQAKARVLEWEVDYQSGELLVKGYQNGKEVTQHVLKTTGSPYALKATVDKQSLKADKKGVAHIVIDIVDSEGNAVYNAENEIAVTVEGPAKLLGLESGSLVSHEDYKANKRKALRGKLLAYLQAEQKKGEVKVTFQSPGLQPQTIVLPVQ